ncbi:protein translocase SEC61 complex subunit gamma [Candidatus Pacearchaeota archaeon ex4484_26]|nr:MAG: protein translocase SEC61 complex subunit gamma [Candidatus Pacearchaeota archaeon ex4484_26]
MKFKKYLIKLRSFYEQSKRVWLITRKPTPQEFRTVTIASGAGITIIGLIGFVLYAIWQVFGFFR